MIPMSPTDRPTHQHNRLELTSRSYAVVGLFHMRPCTPACTILLTYLYRRSIVPGASCGHGGVV